MPPAKYMPSEAVLCVPINTEKNTPSGFTLNKCARLLPTLQVQLKLDSPFDCLGSVYNVLAKYGATSGGEEYTDRGKARLVCAADADSADDIIHALADATSGKVKAQVVQHQE
jgi:hypothetical protein